MAPEMESGGTNDCRSDMFGAGVIMAQLLKFIFCHNFYLFYFFFF